MTLASLVWGWRFPRQQLVEVDFRAGADAAAYGLPVGDGNLPVLEHGAAAGVVDACLVLVEVAGDLLDDVIEFLPAARRIASMFRRRSSRRA
jgi:hypothetical protein